MSKIDKLYHWCLKKKSFTSVDVAIWSMENYFMSAPRRIRKFCEEGLLRSLSDEEKINKGLLTPDRTRLAAWEVV